jgi:hypothetical protein
MTFHKVSYERYNVTVNMCNKEILVATIRTPLIGLDSIFVDMYFPYEECSSIRLDTTYLVESEILEKAKQIIIKKLYRLQSNLLTNIQIVDFETEKYKGKYSISDNFSHGKVYAVR